MIDTSINNEKIKESFNQLLESVKKRKHEKSEIIKIEKAFEMACKYHENTYRKSGEPFILHPIAVAKICIDEMNLDTSSVICALLHDTIEDTSLTLEEIKNTFGSEISEIINGLTKVSHVISEYSSTQAETFKKIILTVSSNIRIILVKIADRLHNLRTLNAMPKRKQIRIAAETLFLYAPVAHRLGFNTIKTELENISFKYKDAENYNLIQQKLKKNKDVRARFIEHFFHPIKKELTNREINFTYKIRPKSIYSIWNKMKSKNIEFEEIYDLFALRIVVDCEKKMEKTKCWEVYAVTTEFYQPKQDRLRDWISIPKSNGYESLQTTVMSKTGKWVEIQIRSKQMDEIAEQGYAAHWKYKTDKHLEKWLENLKDIANSEEDALELVDNFKLNLFKDDITLFTPKGDSIVLPKNSTVLDFAFNIHSDLGFKCKGAMLNGKLKPLSYVLRQSQQVNIITSNEYTVNSGWLSFIKSHTAKVKIQNYIKKQRRIDIKQGKDKLLIALSKYKITNNGNINIGSLTDYFNEVSIDHLLLKINNKDIDLSVFKDFEEKKGNLVQKKSTIKTLLSRFQSKKYNKSLTLNNNLLLIDSNMNIISNYSLSNCCENKNSSNIIGYINDHGNLEIHKTSCEEAENFLKNYSYRIKRVSWISRSKMNLMVELLITGFGKQGVLYEITEIVSFKYNLDIKSVNISDKDGVFECVLIIFTLNQNKLKELTENLLKIKSIKSVVRTK